MRAADLTAAASIPYVADVLRKFRGGELGEAKVIDTLVEILSMHGYAANPEIVGRAFFDRDSGQRRTIAQFLGDHGGPVQAARALVENFAKRSATAIRVAARAMDHHETGDFGLIHDARTVWANADDVSEFLMVCVNGDSNFKSAR